MKSKPTPTPKPLILNIADDLLSPIDLMGRLIEKEVHMVAKAIGIDSEELQAWITLQTSIQIHAPAKTILHLLRTAKEYRLDPLQEEVVLTQYDDSWQVSISIDGWIKLINRHPAFAGLAFTESPENVDGLPVWMECAIHRTDRILPTTTREYLVEVKNDSDIWKKMPRRMLRHRTLQQCARLAFAIHPLEAQTEKQHSERVKQKTLGQQGGTKAYPAMSAQDNLGGIVGLKMRLKE